MCTARVAQDRSDGAVNNPEGLTISPRLFRFCSRFILFFFLRSFHHSPAGHFAIRRWPTTHLTVIRLHTVDALCSRFFSLPGTIVVARSVRRRRDVHIHPFARGVRTATRNNTTIISSSTPGHLLRRRRRRFFFLFPPRWSTHSCCVAHRPHNTSYTPQRYSLL